MKSLRLALVGFLACMLLCGSTIWPGGAALALDFPPLTGRVVDDANIIPPAARDEITQKLAAHEQKTSDQIVVATVKSLQGDDIEDFANRLFRFWKLGQAKTNNGVLLLVAPNEHKVRIEVGYGLEGTLTDALSSVIISTVIAPKFKAGDFGGGIAAGVDAITATLTGDNEWQQRVKVRQDQDGTDYQTLVFFLIMGIFLLVFFMSARQAARQQVAGKYHRTADGRWILLPGAAPWGSGGGWGGGFGGGSFGGGGFGGGFSGGGGSSGGGGASGSW